MSIWFTRPDLSMLEGQRKDTLVEHLDIQFTEIGDDFLSATMPVDSKTRQPFGLLHGGASVALAETIGSVAANMVVDPSRFYCVGLDINANHVRAAKAGTVTGTGTALHLGNTTQVWQIRIVDDSDELISIARLTMAVLSHGK